MKETEENKMENPQEECINQNENVNEENATDVQNSNEDVAQENCKELEDLQNKYIQLNDSYLRLHAEYDNYRKRTLKEKAELIKNGGETVLKNILPVIDDFEHAIEMLQKSETAQGFIEGVELIYNKFQSYLKQNGVKQMEVIGTPFDAELHEAVTMIPAPSEDQKGKIIDCIQNGYFLNEKVIRFAKVIVGE